MTQSVPKPHPHALDSRIADTPEAAAAYNEDPGLLIAAAREALPGWSAAYGGPVGVAILVRAFQRELEEIMQTYAALRAAAVAELLRDESLADVGRRLGISKTAVHELSRASKSPVNEFIQLNRKGLW